MARVAVIGGGIAGLTVAWELAVNHSSSGVQVDLYEAGDRFGGVIAPVTLGGIPVDAGAEAFATRTPAVAEFLTEVGLNDQIISPNPAGAWLQLPEGAAPMPATGLLGIPGDPTATDVRTILGETAADRAAEDLSAPMTWTLGQTTSRDTPSLGEVVADRMGAAVEEKLVSPITSGVHSANPYDLPISTAHPKLYELMCQEGSLARAVATLRANAPAGSAVQSLRGGMNTLISTMVDQLRTAGAKVHLGTTVRRPEHLVDQPDHIVLAVDGPQAVALAADWTGQQALAESAPAAPAGGVGLVTLLVQAPQLDNHPRGTGMLVAPTAQSTTTQAASAQSPIPAPIRAKAMTHISAKWDWVAQELTRELGSGHHLVRLSYGRTTDTAQGAGLGFHSTDEQLLDAAPEDLQHLTGAQIDATLDSTVVRWARGLPAASAQARTTSAALRESLSSAALPYGAGLSAVGAWFAGTGLAQVIPDARRHARNIVETL